MTLYGKLLDDKSAVQKRVFRVIYSHHNMTVSRKTSQRIVLIQFMLCSKYFAQKVISTVFRIENSFQAGDF